MTGLGNLPAVIDLNEKLNPTFIALQETWLRSFKNARFAETLRTHRWYIKNADSQLNEEDMVSMRNLSFHGVALGVDTALAERVEELNVQHRNIVALRVKITGLTLILINIYMPTAGKDQEFQEATDAVRSVVEENATDDSKIIIVGDTNVTPSSTSRRITAWRTLLEELELTDNTTGYITHLHHATQSTGELDRFITREVDLDISVVEDNIGTSDHFPVRATMKIEKQQEKLEVKGDLVETKVDIQALMENQEMFEEITDRLAEEIETWRDQYDLDTQNAFVSTMIFRAAIEVTGQEEYQSQKQRKPKKFKVNKELRKGLRTAKRNYKKQGDKSKSTKGFGRVKYFKRLIREDIKRQMEEYEWGINSQLIEATKEKSSKIFSILKKVKQQTVSENKLPSHIEGYGLRFEAPAVLDGLKELFQQQTSIDYVDRFNEERFEAAKDLVERMRNCDWDEEEYEAITISEEEFQKTVDKMKRGKAQDFMGMSNDLLKMVGKKMHDLIYRMTTESLEKREIGGIIRNFGKGTLIVKKPGKPTTVIKNWRKIVCNNTILNILQLHVQPKIEKKVRRIQTPYQLGFTAGIPISSAVVAREELQQISKHMNRTLFIGVLDLQSCFPRICREEMLVLAANHLSKSEWNVLSQLYDNTWGEIRVEAQKSRPFRGTSGSVEGGILSVQILKIYIGVLLDMLEKAGFTSGVHFRLRKLKPGQIGIADDVLLYAWTAAQLRAQLAICQAWADNFRAIFSEEKSVVVIQRAKGDNTKYEDFVLNGKALSIVPTAEHLGIPISEDGDNSEALVTERMSKTRRAIHGTLSLFDGRSFVTAAVKLQVWRTQYRFILIYGLDTANIKASQLRKLEQFQTKILRSIFKLSKRTSAAKLRLLTGTTTMCMEIWKARFSSLNNILVGSTIVRDLCTLAYHCEIKNSWTYKTVKKMFDILESENAAHLINAETILSDERKSFKENIKNLMFGIERRKIHEEVKEKIYTIPHQPCKEPFPMLNTGFSFYQQRQLRGYTALFTGDFYRFYNSPCPICVKHGKLSETSAVKDDTEHILSGDCVIDDDPKVQAAWADLKLTLGSIKQDHGVVTGLCSQSDQVKFLLSPTYLENRDMMLSHEDLQFSGLDDLIRKFFNIKYQQRYHHLRRCGVIVRKKQN